MAPNAAPADLTDPPPTDGILPSGVPDDVQVFDLGLLAINDGTSADINVDVRSGTGTLQVLVYGQPSGRVIVTRAEDPNGNLAVSDVPPQDLPAVHASFARGFPAQTFSVNRMLGSTQSGAFLLPNTPSVTLIKGVWKLRVGHYTVDVNAQPPARAPLDRPVRVVVLAKPTIVAGAVQLALHYTGAQGLTAATAPTDAFLLNALEVVRSTFAAVDIEVADVVHLDIPTTLSTVHMTPNLCEGGELDALFAQGGAAPARAVPLFIIDRFSCMFGATDIGDDIGGVAGGLPGAAFAHGSSHGGVAVSASYASRDSNALGVVMAHELGHFLGLYHTRESSQFGNLPIVDAIEDTDASAEGSRLNLMYFANDDDTRLSPGQGQVLRGSPWVTP